jgi:hypothetical protein
VSEYWDDIVAFIVSISAFIAAAAGIAMKHTHKIQQNEVVPVGWAILLYTPTIIVMGLAGGVAGDILASWYGTPHRLGDVLAACFGYLGPPLIDQIVIWARNRNEKK